MALTAPIEDFNVKFRIPQPSSCRSKSRKGRHPRDPIAAEEWKGSVFERERRKGKGGNLNVRSRVWRLRFGIDPEGGAASVPSGVWVCS